MTPRTPNGDKDRKQALCDEIVSRAAHLMAEAGAPMEMIIDRFTTYATAQTVSSFGADAAVVALRHAADQVEGGLMKHLDPTKN